MMEAAVGALSYPTLEKGQRGDGRFILMKALPFVECEGKKKPSLKSCLFWRNLSGSCHAGLREGETEATQAPIHHPTPRRPHAGLPLGSRGFHNPSRPRRSRRVLSRPPTPLGSRGRKRPHGTQSQTGAQGCWGG